MELTTERLQIRPVTVEALVAAVEGPAALGRLWDMAVVDDFPGEDFRPVVPILLAHATEHPAILHYTGFIAHRADRAVIGTIGCHAPPDGDGAVEIGYQVDAGYRRRGLATEALHALCAWAEAEPLVRRLDARSLPENEPSRRMLARAGFALEGLGDDGFLVWRRPT